MDAYMIVAPLVVVMVLIIGFVFISLRSKDNPVIYDPKKGKKDFSNYR